MEKVLRMSEHQSEDLSIGNRNGHYAGVEELLAEVNALAIRLNQVGRAPGSSGSLPAGAYSVLQVLERHGPHTVPQIARRRSTSRQNIQMLVNRLQEQGCIELKSNPAHRRSALVNLTSQGRTLLLQGAEVHTSVLETIASQVAETELADTTRLLSGIRRLLSGEEAAAAHSHDQRQNARPRPRRPRPQPERLKEASPAAPKPAPAKPVEEKVVPAPEEFPVSLL